MCGLFGFSGSSEIDPLAISLMALDNEVRGYDSTGVYSVENGLWKIAEKASLAVRMQEFQKSVAGAKMIIGHTRAGTHGVKSSENAHPFVWNLSDGQKFALAHNGWLINVREHAVALGIKEDEYRVDSQLYGLHFLKSRFSLKAIHEDIFAAAALSFIYNNRLYLYRKTSKPLYVAPYKSGILYSSRPDALKLVGAWDNITMLTPDVFYVFDEGELIDTYYFGKSKITLPLDCLPGQWYASVDAADRKMIPGENKTITYSRAFNDEDEYERSNIDPAEILTSAQPYVSNRGKTLVESANKSIKNGELREFATTSINTITPSVTSDSNVIIALVVTGKSSHKKEKWYAWFADNVNSAIRFAKNGADNENRRQFAGCIKAGRVDFGVYKDVIIFNGVDRFVKKNVHITPGNNVKVTVSINANALIALRNNEHAPPSVTNEEEVSEEVRYAAGSLAQIRISEGEHKEYAKIILPVRLTNVNVEKKNLALFEKEKLVNDYMRTVTLALSDGGMQNTASSVLAAYANLSKMLKNDKRAYSLQIGALLEFAYSLEDRLDEIEQEYFEEYIDERFAYAHGNEESKKDSGIAISYISHKDGSLKTISVYGEHRPLAEKIDAISSSLLIIEKASDNIESALKDDDEEMLLSVPGQLNKIRIQYNEIYNTITGMRKVFRELEPNIPESEQGKSDFYLGMTSIKFEVSKVLDSVFTSESIKRIMEKRDPALYKVALDAIQSALFDIDSALGDLAKTLCEDLEIEDILPF